MKKELSGILLLIILLCSCSQKTRPLFLKGRYFDIMYDYEEDQRAVKASSYGAVNYDITKNTFYIRRYSDTNNKNHQLEYFKIEKDVWLEVRTQDSIRILSQLKILKELTEKDTVIIFSPDDYETQLRIIQYNKIDTLSSETLN